MCSWGWLSFWLFRGVRGGGGPGALEQGAQMLVGVGLGSVLSSCAVVAVVARWVRSTAWPQYVPAIMSTAPSATHTVSLSPPRVIPIATAQIGSVPSSRLARLAEVRCTA